MLQSLIILRNYPAKLLPEYERLRNIHALPLIIIGFIAPSITRLKSNASRMLGLALVLAYSSSVCAALMSMGAGFAIIPNLSIQSAAEGLRDTPELLFTLAIDPIMSVMSALVFSVLVGLAATWAKADTITNVLEEFQRIVLDIVTRVIIPILPFFIAGTFAGLAYQGSITKQLPVFLIVILIVMVGHYIWLAVLYGLAGAYSGENPWEVLRHYGPAYLTAVGTMSSAATLAVAVIGPVFGAVADTKNYKKKVFLVSVLVGVAGCVEAVRISDKATVSAQIPFNLDKLPSSAGSITLENQAGIPISCTINGVEEGQTVQAQQKLEVSLATAGLEEMAVDVEWYLDGESIGKGTAISLTPQPGQHRLDVVASTDKLGSSGSTTIKFEAALLGQTGVPVMGGRVTESSVEGLSLSGDMVMDFLVDGNLMIIDNDADRIQTCAIVRNTLRVDGSQKIDDDIVVAASIPGTAHIGFATRGNKVAMYDYSSGTGKFSEVADGTCLSGDGKVFYNGIYGISRKGHGEGRFAVFGFLRIVDFDKPTNAFSLHDWQDTENFMASFQQIDGKVTDSYDVFGVHPSGDDAIMIDRQTRRAFAYFQHLEIADRFDTIYGELPQLTDPDAVTVLPSSGRNILRILVADGDRFLIYEGDKNGKATDGFTYRESMIRPEGSGLDSVRFVLNASDTFLYVLNQGNESVSTYEIGSEGKLTYKAMTELGFSPVDAVISPAGDYMAVYGTGGEFALLRIRTEA